MYSFVKLPNAVPHELGGCSISDPKHTQHKSLGQSSILARRSLSKEPRDGASTSNSKEKKTAGAKRQRVAQRASSHEDESPAVESDTPLKVLGGSKPLVDDYDDEIFEARKV